MRVYGIFSASVPNVDNDVLYGGIKLSNIVTYSAGECGINMYYFSTQGDGIFVCNGIDCNVHYPMRMWIKDRKVMLGGAMEPTNIVTSFLLFFLNIFENNVLGIQADISHQHENYDNMAHKFTAHMQRSLARCSFRGRWTTRR